MNKIIFTIFLGLMFFSGTLPEIQKGEYRIEGNIDRSFDGYRAVLSRYDHDNQRVSREICDIADGRFLFEGEEKLENLASIIIEDRYGTKALPVLGLILEKGTTMVSYPGNEPRMEGTHLNELYLEYSDSMKYYNSRIAEIGLNWTGSSLYIPSGSELSRLFYQQGKVMMDFIRQNYSNPLGRTMLMSVLSRNNITGIIYLNESEQSIDETFDFVDDETRNHSRFVSYVNAYKKSIEKSPLVGKKLSDQSLLTSEGEKVQLSEYIGKKEYLFLEFWASWCGPCIASIPELKDIYAEYSDKLEIVSVSLDTDVKSWSGAMQEYDMPWPQVADIRGFDSDIAKELTVKSIPFGILLDKEGVIIDRFIGTQLREYLENNGR